MNTMELKCNVRYNRSSVFITTTRDLGEGQVFKGIKYNPKTECLVKEAIYKKMNDPSLEFILASNDSDYTLNPLISRLHLNEIVDKDMKEVIVLIEDGVLQSTKLNNLVIYYQ